MPKVNIYRIRFGSYTFDKITKDVKANVIDKLSHFGGTAGLFNGFSIISVFEILAFIFSLFFNLFIIGRKKDNPTNIVEVREAQTKTNENKDDVVDRLDTMKQELVIFEEKMNMVERELIQIKI